MFASTVRRLSITSMLVGLFLLLFTSSSSAALIFTGQNIDVTYSAAGDSDITDSIVAGAGSDIAYLDGSNIGGIMLDFEFIDFVDNAVTFQLRGDGAAHSTGYYTTGLTGSYIISLMDINTTFDSVSINILDRIIGVSIGSEITFDAHNIYFDVSTLGILEVTPGADLGLITLDVGFALVPLPAALPLMLSGIAGLALFSRRKMVKK